MGKGEQTQTWFFLIQAYFSSGSNAPFEVPLEFGARKLASYIFVAGVQLTSLPYYFSPANLQRTLVVLLLPPDV